MWVAVGLIVVLALILVGAWAIDRSAAKRGLKVNVRHTGLRREVTYTRIEETGDHPPSTNGPPRNPPPD